MNKAFGVINTPCIECINPFIPKYRIRWNFEFSNAQNAVNNWGTFDECDVEYKPSLDIIKIIISDGINRDTENKIKNSFVWNGLSVWLSTENQLNYKSAYDLAVQTNGANLPVTFKFGSMDEPVYHEFTTIEELQDFYLGVTAHINSCLQEGWKKKDNINWSEYEELLSKI